MIKSIIKMGFFDFLQLPKKVILTVCASVALGMGLMHGIKQLRRAWKKEKPNYRVDTDMKAEDVVIVGAGISGLSAAIQIQKKTKLKHIVILERMLESFQQPKLPSNATPQIYPDPNTTFELLRSSEIEQMKELGIWDKVSKQSQTITIGSETVVSPSGLTIKIPIEVIAVKRISVLQILLGLIDKSRVRIRWNSQFTESQFTSDGGYWTVKYNDRDEKLHSMDTRILIGACGSHADLPVSLGLINKYAHPMSGFLIYQDKLFHSELTNQKCVLKTVYETELLPGYRQYLCKSESEEVSENNHFRTFLVPSVSKMSLPKFLDQHRIETNTGNSSKAEQESNPKDKNDNPKTKENPKSKSNTQSDNKSESESKPSPSFSFTSSTPFAQLRYVRIRGGASPLPVMSHLLLVGQAAALSNSEGETLAYSLRSAATAADAVEFYARG
ncbi:uncharacterized protein MONOS_15181p1 [Monocercomonoides exilis]|uniref:uncharacterized protein n=1 Tax=Monocercomonoides exilis TaxID=2049356 RepID=UPI0035596CF9|nr:hypothetical protein MONOS_15181p1 [Monocercomonoides exilis]